MKRLKLLFTYVIAFICIMTTLFLPQKKSEIIKTMTTDMENTMLIYMLNEEDLLVPITLSYQKNDTDEENIMQMFQLMKQEIEIFDLKALIPHSLKCLSVNIENHQVILDMNEAFYTMNSHIELRVIEAIVSSILQFDEDYRVEFTVNHKNVAEMPLSALPMKAFDTTLGVNNFNLDATELHQSISKQVVVLHEYDENSYYMVMSQRYASLINDLEFVNEVLHKTSMKLECENLEIKGDEVFLYLNKAFLIEENLIDPEKILPLLYTLKMNQIGSRFRLFINDEIAQVEGFHHNEINIDDLNLNLFEE